MRQLAAAAHDQHYGSQRAAHAGDLPRAEPLSRTIRASSTVLAGYSEDSVTTMLSGPCRVASRYRALASMSITPAKMTSAVTCAGIRRDRPPAIAMTAKSVVETVRATSSGHMPAVDPAWANDRRNKPIAMPEASAVPTPDGRLRGDPGSACWGCAPSCCWLTSTIETIPNAMPATASGTGRSPSNTETTTGMATAHTAVVGATTAIVPVASA